MMTLEINLYMLQA